MKVISVVSAMLFAGSALAQEQQEAYFGVGLGQLDYQEDAAALAPGLVLEDSTEAYEIYGGYRFSDTWAVEGSWGQTGDLEWIDSAVISGLGLTTARLRGDYQIMTVSGVAHLNAFMIGVGYYDSSLDADISINTEFGAPFALSASEDGDGATITVGGEWDFNSWALRTTYDWYDTEDEVDAHTLGLSVHRKF